jgi:hypothetical protein
MDACEILLRAIFFKTILAKNESSLGEKRFFFSDSLYYSVKHYGVGLLFWTSFQPLGVGSKLIIEDLADCLKNFIFESYSSGIGLK